MNYIFVAPDLNPPTYETLEERSYKSFKRIERFLDPEKESSIRISVTKEREEFLVSVDFSSGSDSFFTKEKHRDLRAAIDIVSKELKALILKKKSKNS